MKKITAFLTATAATVGFALGSATTASAKDLCLTDAGDPVLVFSKVKALKPGGAIALTGTWLFNGNSWPMSGSAIMKSNSSVMVQIFVGTPGASDMGPRVEWVADSTFAGTGYADNDNDNVGDSSLIFTVQDCATVVFP